MYPVMCVLVFLNNLCLTTVITATELHVLNLINKLIKIICNGEKFVPKRLKSSTKAKTNIGRHMLEIFYKTIYDRTISESSPKFRFPPTRRFFNYTSPLTG